MSPREAWSSAGSGFMRRRSIVVFAILLPTVARSVGLIARGRKLWRSRGAAASR